MFKVPVDDIKYPGDFLWMYSAGKQENCIKTGNPKLDLIKFCEEQVVNMIKDGKISHKNFKKRTDPLTKKYQRIKFIEIVAECFGTFNNPKEGAKVLFKSWYISLPHRKALESTAKIYGFSLGYSHKQKSWFGVGIIGI